MLFKLATFAALVGAASAACPNQCSGHGTCGNQDVCECYDNWGMGGAVGGDCSDRLCPFELAWVDAPNAAGDVHNYAECSAKGVCDRGTGECDCLDGYEGKACARQVCKAGCNGHGTCAYMDQIPFGTVSGDYGYSILTNKVDHKVAIGDVGAKRLTTPQDAWDFERARACICDSEWTGISCDKKSCPHGSDSMFLREYYDAADYSDQKQTITLVGLAAWSTESFALTFTSRTNQTFTTVPILAAGTNAVVAAAVNNALEGLPNGVIDSVTVTVDSSATNTKAISVVFDGDNVQGRQNLLELDIDPCGAGCTPLVTGLLSNLVQSTSGIKQTVPADFNTYECGRRGKCDYDTGTCACFEGFTGAACSTITALI